MAVGTGATAAFNAGTVSVDRFAAAVELAQAKIDFLQGDKLALLRNRFKEIEDTDLSGLKGLQDVGAHFAAVETQAGRFSQTLGTVQAKINQINGDSLAVLRNQFRDLVPESELAKLQALQNELKRLEGAQVAEAEAASASARASAEAAAAEERQAQAAEKAAVASQAAAEKAQAASNKAGLQFGERAGFALLNTAEAFTVAGGAAAIFAGNFDKHMTDVKHNMTLTDEEFAKFRQGVLDMGQESGLPFDKLAEGMRHLVNEGYTVPEALNIGRVAMMGARAAGSDTEKTFNLLAGIMHTFRVPVEDAAKAWNTVHVAANEGNLSVEEFVEKAGPALAMAASFKLPLNDVAAAFSTLTRNQYSAAQANTLLRGLMSAVVRPSRQAQEAITDLSAVTGVNLVRDFNVAALQSKGLLGVVDDLARATGGNAGIIIKDLIPSMRGGAGAANLITTGFKDFHDISVQTADAMQGRLDPTTRQYGESMNTAAAKLEVLRNTLEAKFLPVGEKFADLLIRAFPTIERFADRVVQLADAFLKMPAPLQDAVFALGAFKLANDALGNPISGTIGLLKSGVDWFIKYRAASLAASTLTGAGAAEGAAVAGGATAAAGGGLLATAGSVATGAVGLAARLSLPTAILGGLVAASPAGQGGDINQSTQEVSEQLIHFATQLQRNQESLAAFHNASVPEQAHIVALMGAGTADAYEAQLRANVTALRARVVTLEQLRAAEHTTAIAHAASVNYAGVNGGDFGGASRTAGTAAATEAQQAALEAKMKAVAAARSAAAREEKAFQSDLATEQAKLTEAMGGGDKAAQNFAAHLKGLTEAHREQILAVHAHLLEIQAATKEREKQAQIETKFHQALEETNNRIRAAHDTEVGGLEKLHRLYPGVSDDRLQYLLSQRDIAKAAEDEEKQHDKLTQTLSGLQSEVSAGTEANKLHKVAVELTGKAYEDLSASSQALVEKIANVKKEMADTKAVEEMHKKVAEAADKLRALQLPPLERGLVQFVGGIKVFEQMSASMQETARAEFILMKAHEAAGASWEAGTRGLSLYDAAMNSLQRTAAATRRELAATGDQLNSQSKQLADLEYQMLQRVASGRAGTVDQQMTAERQLREERQAEEYYAARYGAFSSTGAGDIASARRLQEEVANAPNEQLRMAAEHVLKRNFNPGVLDQLADEAKLRALQGEVEGTRDKANKLQNQLRENDAEINSFQSGMNKIPTTNAAVAHSFDPVVTSLQKTAAAFDDLGNRAAAAMQKISFPQGGFPPQAQGINGARVPTGPQGVFGSDGGVFQQAHQQGVFAGDGFAQGVQDSTGAASQSTANMAQQAIDTVSNMLGIQSPSRVFATIGQYVVDGLAVGVKNGTRTVQEAMSGLMNVTIGQALSMVPSQQSWKQIAAQQSVASLFASQVATAGRQHDMMLAAQLGATNPGGYGDILAEGQYAQLRQEAMRYPSLNVAGQTMTQQGAANQLSGATVQNYNINMTVHTPDVVGFQMSRQQIMQDMYEQGQMASQKNG